MGSEQVANTGTQEKAGTGAFAAKRRRKRRWREKLPSPLLSFMRGVAYIVLLVVLFLLGFGIGAGIALSQNLLLDGPPPWM